MKNSTLFGYEVSGRRKVVFLISIVLLLLVFCSVFYGTKKSEFSGRLSSKPQESLSAIEGRFSAWVRNVAVGFYGSGKPIFESVELKDYDSVVLNTTSLGGTLIQGFSQDHRYIYQFNQIDAEVANYYNYLLGDIVHRPGMVQIVYVNPYVGLSIARTIWKFESKGVAVRIQ
jgi:hypothetical protein